MSDRANHSLAATVGAILVYSCGLRGRPWATDGECTTLLAVRLWLRRLKKDKPSLSIFVIHIACVLACIVALQS